MSNPTVAVITSTIGREHLRQAILSVKNQTYPCKHYVFVDGEQFHEATRKILAEYPEVIATYLPMNTGANGWTNSSINAIAPYLIKEDLICYLDDDNWYKSNHVESAVRILAESNADYAYSLRQIYTEEGKFLCPDNFESVGFYNIQQSEHSIPFPLIHNHQEYSIALKLNKMQHIDTNCYIMKRNVALAVSSVWYSGVVNDTNILKRLIELNFNGVCTKKFSVHYRQDPLAFNPSLIQILERIGITSIEDKKQLSYQAIDQIAAYFYQQCGNKFPWE